MVCRVRVTRGSLREFRLFLPVKLWLLQRLRHCDIPLSSVGQDIDVECVAVAEVAPSRHVEGPLSHLSEEELVLWEFFSWPADAVFLRIVDVWVAESSSSILVESQIGHRRGDVMVVKRVPNFCMIPTPISEATFRNAAGAQRTLTEFWLDANIPAFSVPRCISSLIVERRWASLCYLVRWKGPSVFPGWPSQDWQLTSSGKHCKEVSGKWDNNPVGQDGKAHLHSAHFSSAADDLREFASLLSDSHRDKDTVVAQFKMWASSVVTWLDDCGKSLADWETPERPDLKRSWDGSSRRYTWKTKCCWTCS